METRHQMLGMLLAYRNKQAPCNTKESQHRGSYDWMCKCGNVGLREFFGAITMSRLTIDMTDQQHQNLKAMAALQGKTIKQYTLERLFPADDQAWQELQAVLSERIRDGLAGKISARSVNEILDEELAEKADD